MSNHNYNPFDLPIASGNAPASKIKPDANAFPHHDRYYGNDEKGMNIRAYMALHLMQGIIQEYSQNEYRIAAERAVMAADALIKELNDPQTETA